MSDAGKRWAALIRNRAFDCEVAAVIAAANAVSANRQANRAALIVACAQMLAQSLAAGGPDIAREMREGIMELIDAYAMQVAVADDA